MNSFINVITWEAMCVWLYKHSLTCFCAGMCAVMAWYSVAFGVLSHQMAVYLFLITNKGWSCVIFVWYLVWSCILVLYWNLLSPHVVCYDERIFAFLKMVWNWKDRESESFDMALCMHIYMRRVWQVFSLVGSGGMAGIWRVELILFTQCMSILIGVVSLLNTMLNLSWVSVMWGEPFLSIADLLVELYVVNHVNKILTWVST